MTRYKNTQKIGAGAFGEVWLAKSEHDDMVARKYLGSPEKDPRDGFSSFIRESEELRKRFEREVRIQLSLDHPNVVPVLDYNMDATTPWFVMPLAGRLTLESDGKWKVSDHNLRELLNEDYGVRQLDLFDGLLVAVEYIHNSALHRDLKPENVLIYWNNGEPLVRVSDFGHGRLIDRDTPRLTSSQQAIGTVLYMAPEQRTKSGNETPGCDIYSLGLMLYETLTGIRPPLPQSPGDVPGAIWKVIIRATRRYPGDRYQSISEFRQALNEAR